MLKFTKFDWSVAPTQWIFSTKCEDNKDYCVSNLSFLPSCHLLPIYDQYCKPFSDFRKAFNGNIMNLSPGFNHHTLKFVLMFADLF